MFKPINLKKISITTRLLLVILSLILITSIIFAASIYFIYREKEKYEKSPIQIQQKDTTKDYFRDQLEFAKSVLSNNDSSDAKWSASLGLKSENLFIKKLYNSSYAYVVILRPGETYLGDGEFIDNTEVHLLLKDSEENNSWEPVYSEKTRVPHLGNVVVADYNGDDEEDLAIQTQGNIEGRTFHLYLKKGNKLKTIDEFSEVYSPMYIGKTNTLHGRRGLNIYNDDHAQYFYTWDKEDKLHLKKYITIKEKDSSTVNVCIQENGGSDLDVKTVESNTGKCQSVKNEPSEIAKVDKDISDFEEQSSRGGCVWEMCD